MPSQAADEFVFKYYDGDGTICRLRVAIHLPLSAVTIHDLASQFTNAHDIPDYAYDALLSSLRTFVTSKTQERFDERADGLRTEKAVNAEELAKLFLREHKNTSGGAPRRKAEEVAAGRALRAGSTLTEDESFSHAFHELIHSCALQSLLKMEWQYAEAVRKLIAERDETLADLQAQQSDAIDNSGKNFTDEEINSMANSQFETTQELTADFSKRIYELKREQRVAYRNYVMKLHRDGAPEPSDVDGDVALHGMPPAPKLQESFTVNLGAQMKNTHNLRLVSAKTLELCQHVDGVITPHTCISLYSNSLTAMILLVDNRINSYTGIKKQFAGICEQSTDFHFPTLDEQLEDIRRGRKSAAKTGDFYVTRHSNLANVHVIFHVVVDDSVKSADMTSRHPIIFAIRNVLKLCSVNDIDSISIPLLLCDDLTEEMTVAWCVRRAELVFKCVKGFMIELANSQTVHFQIPQNISHDIFATFSNMLPQIFTVSNPLVLK